MRSFGTDMKAVSFYAFNDVKRRPRETFTLIAITSAIVMTMMLMLLWLEAEWRAEVMPENEENYHFSVTGIADSEAEWIESNEWCRAIYKVKGTDGKTETRVRIKWEYLDSYFDYISKTSDALNLKSRDPYQSIYDNQYKIAFEKYENQARSGDMKFSRISSSPEAAARSAAERAVVEKIENSSFCVKTTQNYLMMPENVIMEILFAVFLGAAVYIITNERFHRDLGLFGTLRAIGFTHNNAAMSCIIKGCIISVLSIIPATVGTVGVVAIYNSLSKSHSEEGAYLTISGELRPVIIVLSFVFLIAVTVISNVMICRKFKDASAMDELRGRETIEIGYVGESSDKFVNGTGRLTYAVLYAKRTWRRAMDSALSVAMLVPLPMFFMTITSLFTGELAGAERAYFLLQKWMLIMTASAVTCLAMIYTVKGRGREISMLRSIGADKRRILTDLMSSAVLEGGIASVVSGMTGSFVNLFMQDQIMRSVGGMFGETVRKQLFNEDNLIPLYLISWIKNTFAFLPVSFLLVLPAELAGALIAWAIHSRGNIIEGIRSSD